MVDQHDDMGRYPEAQPQPQENFSKRHEKFIRRGIASLAIASAFLGVGTQESQAQDDGEIGTNPNAVLDVGSVSDFDRNRLSEVGLEIADAASQQTPEFPDGSQYAVANPQEGYNSVNIRADQNVNSSIVTTIPRGERIVVDLPELDIDPNDGWYVAYDESGARLGYVHNSVIRIESGEVPPTPGFEIGPTPVQEAPPNTELDENPNITETADTELESGAAPTTIPEVINPTHEPVLTPTRSEELLAVSPNPERSRQVAADLRALEQQILNSMNLTPISSSQVTWIRANGEALPPGIVNFQAFNEELNAEHGIDLPDDYFAVAAVLRGTAEFQYQGVNLFMTVFDVGNNRFVSLYEESMGTIPFTYMVTDSEGNLENVDSVRTSRNDFHNVLSSMPANQEVVLLMWQGYRGNDTFGRAVMAEETRNLEAIRNAIATDTPITSVNIGLMINNSINGMVIRG